MAQQLSANEITFLQRALPHFMAGKSVEDALRAVLDDDARLVGKLFERSTSHYFPTPDERGRAHCTAGRPGDLIVREMSATVHAGLRGEAA